jgi:hypothetical protein
VLGAISPMIPLGSPRQGAGRRRHDALSLTDRRVGCRTMSQRPRPTALSCQTVDCATLSAISGTISQSLRRATAIQREVDRDDKRGIAVS